MDDVFSLEHLLRTIFSLAAVSALAVLILKKAAPYLRARELQLGKAAELTSSENSEPLRLIQRLTLADNAELIVIEDSGGARSLFKRDASGLTLLSGGFALAGGFALGEESAADSALLSSDTLTGEKAETSSPLRLLEKRRS